MGRRKRTAVAGDAEKVAAARPFYSRLPSYEPQFFSYYLRVLAPLFRDEEDRELFAQVLKAPLPACFRLNPAVPNLPSVLERLREAIERGRVVCESSARLFLTHIDWYPGQLVWQLNCDRNELKRSAAFKELHLLLIQATEAGLLSRQELVSMLPPLLLDVQAGDMVLDLCAAPGSKTGQLLEMLEVGAGAPGKVPGGVVANEVDSSRAWILAHQVARLSVPHILVTNHAGQFFPAQQTSEEGARLERRFYYDKVLADVPCSGDAAVRKLPDRYKAWSPVDGPNMHALQLSLLIRAVSLAKLGGLIVYSTCSLNPIENEAVVAEVLRRANAGSPGALELLDAHARLPGVKTRPGLTAWPVLLFSEDESRFHAGDYFEQVELEAVQSAEKKNLRKAFKASVFPGTEEELRELGLQRTARVMPQDMNSSGFYLALLRKNAYMPSLYAAETPAPVPTVPAQPRKKHFLAPAEQVSFNFLGEEGAAELRVEYGLGEDFPMHLVVKPAAQSRRLYLVSQGVYDLLRLDARNSLAKVGFGTTVFARAKRDDGEEFFRLSHSGARLLVPHLASNKHPIDRSLFLWLLALAGPTGFVALAAQSPELAARLQAARSSSHLLVYLDAAGGFEELLTIFKLQHSVAMMVPREDLAGLRLKYKVEAAAPSS